MLHPIDRRPHGRHVTRDTGGRFVVHQQHALNFVRRIGGECCFDASRIGHIAPRLFDHIHLVAKRACRLDEQVREVAEAHPQQPPTRIHRIDQGGFPHGRARGRENERLALGLMHNLRQSRKDRSRQHRKCRRTMIFHRPMHGAQQSVGNRCRSRDLEKVPSGHRLRWRRKRRRDGRLFRLVVRTIVVFVGPVILRVASNIVVRLVRLIRIEHTQQPSAQPR